MKRKQPPLVILRHKLNVPDTIYKNLNYVEAKCVVAGYNADKSIYDHRVVGTANTKQLELYGWKNPIGMHVDSHSVESSSFCYFSILDNDDTEIVVKLSDYSYIIVCPKRGDIVRLDDSFEHGTTGLGNCVALFCGTFKRSCDAVVAKRMQLGINRLAQNIRSPKIALPLAVGFYHNECYVAGQYKPELSTLNIAEKRSQEILYCHCGEVACVPDKMYPYGHNHVCGNHRKSMP